MGFLMKLKYIAIKEIKLFSILSVIRLFTAK